MVNSTTAIVASGMVLTALTSLVAMKEGKMQWLDGRGLTYNDGEFVEGFTSLTWTILVGMASWLTGLEVAVAALLLLAIERVGGRYLQTGAAGDGYCPSAAERHAPNSSASRAGKL